MKRLRLRRGWLTDGVGHWPEWMILAGLESALGVKLSPTYGLLRHFRLGQYSLVRT
jgi:hypothetical protein